MILYCFGLKMESFRFEDEDDTKTTFNFSLKIDTPGPKASLYFFSPQKLARLSPLKEVKLSPDR